MITVFADKYLFEIASLLPDEVDLHFFDPQKGIPGEQDKIDALLIRTVNKINRHTWQQVPKNLQFIGTGSSGTDHVDLSFLNDHNIVFKNAAGCNARSVAEYIATALLIWAGDFGYELNEKKVGIIGKGHVGTEVYLLLTALNIATVCYDPPKEDRNKNFVSAQLKEVLSCDVLTFHTPLTKTGKYPTYHWLDENKLANRNYDLIINTARGGVVDEQSLLKASINNTVQNFIVDVWENEPVFNDVVAQKAYIKTPHIAGYSKQAKFRASRMIADAFCQHFALEKPQRELGHSFPVQSPDNISTSFISSDSITLSDVLKKIHPIKEYEEKLLPLIGLPPQEKGTAFNKLRAEYPLRDEFSFIQLPNEIIQPSWPITALGLIIH